MSDGSSDGSSAGDSAGTNARPTTEEGLVRAIGVRTLALNIVNLVVGAGIFVLPGIVAAQLGSAAILAYLVCSAAVGLVFLCFAEAGSRVSRSGGAYAYVEVAFGPFAGFLVSALLWFGWAILGDAAIAIALVKTVALAFPWIGSPLPRALFLIGLFGSLAAVNVVGVRQGVRLAVFNTFAKLVPLLMLVAAGAFAIHWRNLVFTEWPALQSIGSTSLILFFAFAGAESALTSSGEIEDPARTVPRGLLLGIGGVLALYLCVHGVAQGVLGAELARNTEAPLAATAERVLGGWGSGLLLLGAGVSIFGTLSVDMLVSPRALFAAARDGLLPARLGSVHPKFNTPHVAIVCHAIVACGFALSGTFKALAIVSSASLLLIYLGCCLAVLELRRRDVRSSTKVFRMAGGPTVPILSSLVVIWLLSHTTRTEAIGLGLLLLAASALYALRRWTTGRARTAAAA